MGGGEAARWKYGWENEEGALKGLARSLRFSMEISPVGICSDDLILGKHAVFFKE